MTPVAVYAGVIVSDLDASVDWYVRSLGCRLEETGDGWACLRFRDGSTVELFLGDAQHPGLTFPSYGADPGPAVMPGYAVADPPSLAVGLRVARRLPLWIVVVAPDGTRLALTDRDGTAEAGLVGFRYASPAPDEQRAFLDRIGVTAEVERADRPIVVPMVAGRRAETLHDPDGTAIDVVGA